MSSLKPTPCAMTTGNDKSATETLRTAADKANCFAKFGAHKFKSLKGNTIDLPDVPGSPESRARDIPSDDELNVCLAAMQRGKAPGHDGAYVDSYKKCPTCHVELFSLIRQIWLEESVPKDMVQGTFVMLYKQKGSTNDCSKYRMVGLLPIAYKMLSTLLLHRMRIECEGFLDEDQAGFRRCRGTRDHIVCLEECVRHA